jgi:hypothetical protein
VHDDITAELAEVEEWEDLQDHLELTYGTKKNSRSHHRLWTLTVSWNLLQIPQLKMKS